MAKFEGQDRRKATLDKVLKEYGFASLDEANELCLSKGINVDEIVKGIQPIAFDNASCILFNELSVLLVFSFTVSISVTSFTSMFFTDSSNFRSSSSISSMRNVNCFFPIILSLNTDVSLDQSSTFESKRISEQLNSVHSSSCFRSLYSRYLFQ